jgi:hypothetical protein
MTVMKNPKPEHAIRGTTPGRASPALPNPGPSPRTPPPTHNPSRRNGKIARLPRETRELINAMLSDGVPYPKIIRTLAEKGGHRLSAANLSRWFSGGYQDWLKEQTCLEEMRTRLDFAAELVNDKNGQTLDQASIRIAIMRLYNLLTDFDPAVLKSKISDQPGCYARILNALCKLADGDLKFERYRAAQEDKAAARAQRSQSLASLAQALA